MTTVGPAAKSQFKGPDGVMAPYRACWLIRNWLPRADRAVRSSTG